MSCDLHLSCSDCEAKYFCPSSDLDTDEVEENLGAFEYFLFRKFCEEHLKTFADGV